MKATAPTAAPVETPMMEGSAIGFRKKPCITVPASASAKPTVAPSAIRGSLMRRTMTAVVSGTVYWKGWIHVRPSAVTVGSATPFRTARATPR